MHDVHLLALLQVRQLAWTSVHGLHWPLLK